MTGLIRFFPFRMITQDKLEQILFGFDMGDAYEIINVAVTDLAAVFHRILFYAVASPAAFNLAAGVFFAASGKTGFKAFRLLDGFDELLFGIFPGVFDPHAPCLAFNL